jgi:hypothetical protein
MRSRNSFFTTLLEKRYASTRSRVRLGIGYGVVHYNPNLKDQVMHKVNEARGTYAQVKDISEIAKRLKW